MPRSRRPLLVALAVGVGAVLVVAFLVARLDESIAADRKACQAVLPVIDQTDDLLGGVADRDADPSVLRPIRASLMALSEELRAIASFDRAQLLADALEDISAQPAVGSLAASKNPVALATVQARIADVLDYCS